MKKSHGLLFLCFTLLSFYGYVLYLAFNPNVSVEYELYFIQKKLRHWNKGSGLHYNPNQRIMFSDNIPYLSKVGWSFPEKWGSWSDGNVAELFIKSDVKLSEIELELSPFLSPNSGLKEQNINFYVNDVFIGHKVLNVAEFFNLKIKIPSSISLSNNGLYTFRFEYQNAISPQELGISDDSRKLAFSYKYIVFN